ncbi:hypothetical protein SLS56_011731 [Neofusicoccum ribis]|uniref:Uncharacterized protein n=1 Tax=Neofusicoccum ribis TaxID=45134 RepID=A0ABR3SBF9_9PEZI
MPTLTRPIQTTTKMDDPIGAFINKCHSTQPSWKRDKLRDQLEQIELVSLKKCIGILESKEADTHTKLLEQMLEQRAARRQQEQQEKWLREERALKQEDSESPSSASSGGARREKRRRRRRPSACSGVIWLLLGLAMAAAAMFAAEWWKAPSEHPMDESAYDLATLFNKTRDAMHAIMGHSETRYPNQIPLQKLYRSTQVAWDKWPDVQFAFGRLWPPGVPTQNRTVESAREMVNSMSNHLRTIHGAAIELESDVGWTLVAGGARINGSLQLQSRALRWVERDASLTGWRAWGRQRRVASMRRKVWQDACECQRRLLELVDTMQVRINETHLVVDPRLEHVNAVIELVLREIDIRNDTSNEYVGRLRDSHREALIDWASWSKNKMRNSTSPIVSLAAGMFGGRDAPHPPYSHLSEPREQCRRLAVSSGHTLSMRSQVHTLERELASIRHKLVEHGQGAAEKDHSACVRSNSFGDPISYVADLNNIWMILINAVIEWDNGAFDDELLNAASD